jgi:hypothetical protein
VRLRNICCGTAEAIDFTLVRRLTPLVLPHGPAGIDPVVLFKMALSYLYGITRERQVAEELRLHSHSCGFRLRLGERTPDY